MAEKKATFLTGSRSKLAKAFEILAKRQWDIEIEMNNGQIITGKVTCFEITPSYFALGIANSGGFYMINFAQTITMRMPAKLVNEVLGIKDPDLHRMLH